MPFWVPRRDVPPVDGDKDLLPNEGGCLPCTEADAWEEP